MINQLKNGRREMIWMKYKKQTPISRRTLQSESKESEGNLDQSGHCDAELMSMLKIIQSRLSMLENTANKGVVVNQLVSTMSGLQ